jgi:hypothetical protein
MNNNEINLAREGENIFDHNIYRPGHGYVTDHIPKNQQRGHHTHWDEQYNESDSFEESWKPRPGVLEFVYNLSKESKDNLVILNMGAGLGDFTRDLARIPKTIIHHVDFSKQGNNIAKQKIISANLAEHVHIHTIDNNIYLEQFIKSSQRADVVFLYGASGSNEPNDSEYQKTLELSAHALKEGGYLWHVTMIQPRLLDSSDTRIQDTLGDFPKPPGMAKNILTKIGLSLVREETQERPDFHPLIPGQDPVHHLHLAYRGLFRKGSDEIEFDFDFQNAIGSEWGSVWGKLCNE